MNSKALINVIDNLESSSITDALSANQGRVLKGLIDELGSSGEEKNIITVSLNSLTTQANGTGTISFSHNYTQVGDKLTLTNGKVVIGSGVTKVKVSVHIWATSSTYVWFKLLRNSTIIGSMIGNDSCGYNTLDVSNKCITVSEGDTISISYNNSGSVVLNQGSGNNNETYLTVEVVE